MQLTPSGRLFRVCATLGIISYPIYCIHWPLIMFLRVPLERAYANAFVAASSFLIAVAVLSYVVNYVYDAPVRRRLQRTFLANSVTGRARSPWIATTDSSIVPRQVGRQAASGETGSLDYAAPD
jgi:peptidoglycan/LPS O-acetylase OafA/YrhL